MHGGNVAALHPLPACSDIDMGQIARDPAAPADPAFTTPPGGRVPQRAVRRLGEAAMPPSTAGLLQNPQAPFDKLLQQREFDADSYCSPVADDSGVASDVSGSIGA